MASESSQPPPAMSSLLARRKIWAAFVMISFLALLLATWAMEAAGRRAVGPPCRLEDAQAKWTPLEVHPPLEGLAQALGEHADCESKALRAKLMADPLFLSSYGALNLFLFLFLATRVWTKRWLVPVLVAGGALLAVVMVGADLWENAELRGWLDGALPPADGPLLPSVVKWLALGAAGALGGVAYLTAPRWWGKLPALAGFVALALFVRGLLPPCTACINLGMGAILLFWFLVLLHAIGASTVALRPLDERSGR